MRSLAITMVLAGATAAAATLALAQPRCVFLECGPANAPNPAPAPAPKVVNAAPVNQARARHTRRPRARSETCSFVQGYDYCVSSVLAPQYGNTYGPGHVVDEDLRTAWVEGKRGQGEGEYLAVSLGKPHRVSGLQIMNGYHKNARLFRANSRVKRATVTFSDGTRRSITLRDEPGVQEVKFPAVEATWVQFKIGSVYKGSKYRDTAITEFRVVTDEDQ